MKTKTTAPQKPKKKTISRSSSFRPQLKIECQPDIDLDKPLFVFLPFFSNRLRAIIDGKSTWYHCEDVMEMPGLEEASHSMHPRRSLVRRITAKWAPFTSKMIKYTVLSESDFYRLMFAVKVIDGKDSWFLGDVDGHTEKLSTPGGDFDARDLEFYRSQLIDRQADWKQSKTTVLTMDDWNVSK